MNPGPTDQNSPRAMHVFPEGNTVSRLWLHLNSENVFSRAGLGNPRQLVDGVGKFTDLSPSVEIGRQARVAVPCQLVCLLERHTSTVQASDILGPWA